MYKLMLSIFLCSVITPVFAGTSYNTEPASMITANNAQLNGNAASTNTAVVPYFNWGTTTEYGYHSFAIPQKTKGQYSLPIGDLHCATTYHFRLLGNPGRSGTTNQGKDMSFTTASCPEKYVDVKAGSIFDNRDAQRICPNVCASAVGRWSGKWTNIISPSVCGCWIPQKGLSQPNK